MKENIEVSGHKFRVDINNIVVLYDTELEEFDTNIKRECSISELEYLKLALEELLKHLKK